MDNSDTPNSIIDTTPFLTSVASAASTYDPEDLVSNTSFNYAITINFTDNTVEYDSVRQDINTSGITVISGVTVSQENGAITVTSTSSENIKYILTGTTTGNLAVESNAAYQLYLNGVTINSERDPALELKTEGTKAFIVTAADTTNILTDDSSNGGKGTIKSKGALIFSGNGTLSVTGNNKHGIYSDDYIRICEGTLNISVTARDGIRSVNGFIFDDGNLTINGTGSKIDDESKGIKVEGTEDSPGEGYIVINGGKITINTIGKAITASWDIDEDAETTSTADDPNPYVQVNNGVITITTTGTPYEYIEDGETLSLSPEGIEGKSFVKIKSGYLIINTTDDSINAGDSIEINGGYLYCNSSDNDAIDSNGTLTITGGVIVAIGAQSPEGAFDSDQNTFAVTGGTFVGIGGGTSTPTASACTQNVVIMGNCTSGKTMALISSDNSVAFSWECAATRDTIVLSSPLIELYETYTIYSGGTGSGDFNFNELYLDHLSYTGGSSTESFNVSSTVTKTIHTVPGPGPR